uniref:NADH-ubiquinone oxidoreductase chain 5 n=1 Tax=Coptosoma bifarium TaxID=1589673 RepID=B7SM95_COPBI|nr:NADH dehydrogenase subunit 5 [Coptosoma bifarium]ABZ01989.1 NADH dehydrogenase subunit 5 [Coptosoma bifarium]
MFNICNYNFRSVNLFVLGVFLIFMGFHFIFLDLSMFLDWELYSLDSVSVTFTLYFDWMSIMFMGVVLLISSMVIYYSSFYMCTDIFMIRFLFMVLLFIFSMMLLIVSPNMFSILLGWDGLGLVSYCLVIYFQNYKSYNAGMLTVLINRLGDVAILVCIAWLFNFGGLNYYFSFHYISNGVMFLFVLISLAAFTKSAQIPFSSWLPAAMAAPTPVSALVHSSTLVTAGVYLLIRFYSLLENFNLTLLLFLSCMTMFMAGLGANFEFDLKKIIALSTLSQLGLMMGVLFLGGPLMSFFHLLSHAFFKALLFLCAGLIIHAMNGVQDIRYMGFLSNQMPFTFTCFCVSTFSLCGLPFLSGFYSKDFILEFLSFSGMNLLIYLLFFFSVGLTVSYSFRLIYYCVGNYTGLCSCQSFIENIHMVSSMVMLTLFSIFFGSLFNWLVLPYIDLMILPLECKILPFILILLGGWTGYELSSLNFFTDKMGFSFPLLVNFFGSMWFMPKFFSYFCYSILNTSHNYFLVLDSGWGEYLVSKSPYLLMSYVSERLMALHFNSIKLVLMGVFLWSAFFLILFTNS